MPFPHWRLIAACACVTTALATPAVAGAAPPPPPPMPAVPGYPPPGLLAPGTLGRPYGYQTFWNPIPPGSPPSQWDAAGLAVGTNADLAASGTGMPGSQLGNSPSRTGPYGPAPGVRVSPQTSAGVQVNAMGADLEDPYGQPPPAPSTNESILLTPALGP